MIDFGLTKKAVIQMGQAAGLDSSRVIAAMVESNRREQCWIDVVENDPHRFLGMVKALSIISSKHASLETHKGQVRAAFSGGRAELRNRWYVCLRCAKCPQLEAQAQAEMGLESRIQHVEL